MRGLEVAALVAVAVWLGVLTCGVLLVVRQVSLLTVRLSFAAPHVNADDDGQPVGSAVSEPIQALFTGTHDRGTLALLTGTCGSCRELAQSVSARLTDDALVFLIAGEQDLAQEVGRLLPDSARRIFDPEATQIANALQIMSSPFGLSVERGVVTAKTYLHSGADLSALLARANRAATSIDVVARNGHQESGREALRS